MKKINFFKALKTQGVKYGGYSALISFAVIVGLIVINLIVGQFDTQADLTSSKIFSLSDQTMDILDDLEKDVTIYVLRQEGSEPEQIMEALRKYDRASDSITVQGIDPEKNPALVEQYREEDKSLSLGSLIVAAENNFKVIPSYDLYVVNTRARNPQVMGLTVEKRVTNALLYVASGYTPIVYELTGHAEYTVGDFPNLGEAFERENLEVKQLNLIQSESVPEDAELVMMWAPERDLSSSEAEKLENYLEERNGRLLFMMDFSSGETPILDSLLESYGTRFVRGIVIEKNQNYHTGNELDLVPDLADHPILEPLKEARFPVMLPRSQGIEPVAMRRRDIEIEPLLSTSAQSFLRTNLDIQTMDKVSSDISGPVNIAAAVRLRPQESADEQTARIILIGSTQFLLTNPFYGDIPGNVDLLMNSISWLQNRQDTITIRSKSVMQFPMRITGTHTIIYSALFVVVIPLISFVLGVVVWLRRRHR